jgi:predicted MFS family arabinose efflux permease
MAGRLARRVPASRLMVAGFSLVALAFVLMAGIRADSSWLVALPGLILLGVGGALAFPPLLGVTLDLVPAERAGMASGLSNTFFPLGTAAGVATFGAIFTSRIGAELPEHGAAVAAGRFDLVSEPARQAAREALTGALGVTCLVAAGAALAAVVISLVLVRSADAHPLPVRT